MNLGPEGEEEDTLRTQPPLVSPFPSNILRRLVKVWVMPRQPSINSPGIRQKKYSGAATNRGRAKEPKCSKCANKDISIRVQLARYRVELFTPMKQETMPTLESRIPPNICDSVATAAEDDSFEGR